VSPFGLRYSSIWCSSIYKHHIADIAISFGEPNSELQFRFVNFCFNNFSDDTFAPKPSQHPCKLCIKGRERVSQGLQPEFGTDVFITFSAKKTAFRSGTGTGETAGNAG